VCPGVDSASKNEYQEIPGGKGDRCVRVTTLPPSEGRKSWKSGTLNLPYFQWPVQACSGKTLPLSLPINVLLYVQGYILVRACFSKKHWCRSSGARNKCSSLPSVCRVRTPATVTAYLLNQHVGNLKDWRRLFSERLTPKPSPTSLRDSESRWNVFSDSRRPAFENLSSQWVSAAESFKIAQWLAYKLTITKYNLLFFSPRAVQSTPEGVIST
jgi:hypothetical protein